MRDIYRQLRTDFRTVPRLVDEYTIHTPRGEALKSSRQVCGVGHYLSLITTGEVDMRKCAAFGVLITCMDEVTDELSAKMHPGAIRDAIDGHPPYEPLACVPEAVEAAEADVFEHAVTRIADAQDLSMQQMLDIAPLEANHVTRMKGGASALAHLAFFKEDISKRDKLTMAKFGYTMQLLDDYLDAPKDRENGLTTTVTAGMHDREHIRGLLDEVEESLRDVYGDSKALRRFMWVCRHHLRLGRIENETPLSASWFAPGYL